MAKTLSADEKRWQADSDARSLAESEVIKGDKTRLGAAVKAAAKMAIEERKRAQALEKAAKIDKKDT